MQKISRNCPRSFLISHRAEGKLIDRLDLVVFVKDTDIDTGYYVTGSDIVNSTGHTGYYISGECVLHADRDTGYYVTGGIVYRRPALDTGFWVSGGIIWGPSRDVPFLT